MLGSKIPRRFFATVRSNQHYINLDEAHISRNYGPMPIAVERAERCYVWDAEGTRYFDCISGFGACN